MENSIEVPQKPKNRTTILPRNSNPGYLSELNEIINLKNTYIPGCIAALFKTAKVRKHDKCPSTDEWDFPGWRNEWKSTFQCGRHDS